MSNPDNTDSPSPPELPAGPETDGLTMAGWASVTGARSPEKGELLGGRFALRRQIGRGGAGTVFSAFDTKVGQQVAVKVLHSDIRESSQLERLRREVRASRPGHPNAVSVYDLFDDGRHRFLTMELVEGRSVSQELAEAGGLAVGETIALGRQIASALAALHAKGLVHRDVKPGNILLTVDGPAKLCDMGLTRSTMRGGTITETEMVVGTPAYMAPEQALAGDLTPASDVYALGLTLYQCLTGAVPLQEDTAVATLMLRQRSRPPKVRLERAECPRWLDRLLRRMLDPEPGRRPSSEAVESALADRRAPLRLAPRRHHVAAALIVLVVAAGSIIVYRSLAHPPAATVETLGSVILGLGGDGRELWRRPMEQSRVDVLRADLDGDGNDEVLAVGMSDVEAGGLSTVIRHSQILILDASGEIVTRLDPEAKIGDWPYRYRLEVNPTLHVVDLDGDGWIEVVAVCRQRRYFPTEVLVFWPRWGVWDHVLSHSGSIYTVFPPQPGSEPGFRFLGVNNRLAMYGFLGEMQVVPPNRRRTAVASRSIKSEAPPFGRFRMGVAGGLSDYVPLVPQNMFESEDVRTIERTPDGGWSVAFFSQAMEFDAFLNLADGPNAGRDLRDMRRLFYRLLYKARPGFRTFTPEGIEMIRHEMESTCGPLLTEPSYEAIFLDTIGRALARVDDPEGAVALLRPAFERLQNDDLGYRLSNLEAISGDLSEAAAWLRLLMDDPKSRRAGFDAPHLMLRIAVEERDIDLAESAISYLTGLFRDSPDRSGVETTLWAGARLWWDEGTEADSRVRSVDYSEDGDAVAGLIRWRRGSSRSGDPDAMRTFVDTNPDAAGIGSAALIAAMLGNSQAAEAIVVCDTAASLIGEWSKNDFREFQNLQLIQALRTVALLQAGDRQLARREALRLETSLDSRLLPGIVVGEVLNATAD